MVNADIVPKPSVAEVKKYLQEWERLDNYVHQERALQKLLKLLPENKDIDDILLKVSAINNFYSTNIFAIYTVAQHILNKDIDQRLKMGDVSLVKDIERVVIKGKEKHFYSFATKYCSHHNPSAFPIYDNFVDKMLCSFNKEYKFATFKKPDLKDYEKFYKVLLAFQKAFGLEQFNLKQLDRYLWMLGKEIFGQDKSKRRN